MASSKEFVTEANWLGPKVSRCLALCCIYYYLNWLNSHNNNWNSLSLHIRSSDNLATFKSCLKSHLFASAYHVQSSTHQRFIFDFFYYWRSIFLIIGAI